MVILPPDLAQKEKGIISLAILSPEEINKNPADIAFAFYNGLLKALHDNSNETEITHIPIHGYLVIPYKRIKEDYEVSKYIYQYTSLNRLFLIIRLLKLMAAGEYEYKVFVCAYKKNDEEYIGLPCNDINRIIIDVTKKHTRAALNYKTIIEQLD